MMCSIAVITRQQRETYTTVVKVRGCSYTCAGVWREMKDAAEAGDSVSIRNGKLDSV